MALYLERFAPPVGREKSSAKLHASWDSINVEELYAAIEFESRITDHLLLQSGERGSGARFFHEYFSAPYREAVTQVMQGSYKDWMRSAYSSSYGSQAFPHLHENFLRVVKMELVDSLAYTLRSLSEREDTSNFSRLVREFQPGDTVITFNYDLLVEHHLAKERPADWSYRTVYGLRPTSKDCSLEFDGNAADQPSKFTVLKPHGSSNWHFRLVPGNGPRRGGFEGYRTVPESVGAGNLVRDVRPAALLVTDHCRKAIAESESAGYYERFMIPPSTYKAEYSFSGEFVHLPNGDALPLRSSTLWLPQLLYRHALHALSRAERLVFIGFSMAPADTSMRMLFRAAADANTGVRLVEIADPACEVTRRIQSVIPNAGEYRRFQSFSDLLGSWAGAGESSVGV